MSHAGTLIYLLTGHGSHRSEALLSVYSSLRSTVRTNERPEFKVVFYSDQPLALPPEIAITTQRISPATYSEWTLSSQSLFRLKFYAILDALSKFGGPCLYLDSDTYFTKPPTSVLAQIRPGCSVMHMREGKIGDVWPFLVGTSFRQRDGTVRTIDEPDEMWNAGVIGLHASDVGLIDDFIAVHDSLGPPYHGLCEQFSVGQVLKHDTRLHQAGDAIYHYWGSSFRERYCPILDEALKASTGMVVSDRCEFLYRHRPRLTAWQTCKTYVKRPLMALSLISRAPRASHGCYAPGLPRHGPKEA